MVARLAEVGIEVLALDPGRRAHADRHRPGRRAEIRPWPRDCAQVRPRLRERDRAIELDDDDLVAPLNLTLVVAILSIIAVAVAGAVAGRIGLAARLRVRPGGGDGGPRGLEDPGQRTVEALPVEPDDRSGEAHGVRVTVERRDAGLVHQQIRGLPVGAARQRRIEGEVPRETGALAQRQRHDWLIEAQVDLPVTLAATEWPVVDDVERTARARPRRRTGPDGGGIEGGEGGDVAGQGWFAVHHDRLARRARA